MDNFQPADDGNHFSGFGADERFAGASMDQSTFFADPVQGGMGGIAEAEANSAADPFAYATAAEPFSQNSGEVDPFSTNASGTAFGFGPFAQAADDGSYDPFQQGVYGTDPMTQAKAGDAGAADEVADEEEMVGADAQGNIVEGGGEEEGKAEDDEISELEGEDVLYDETNMYVRDHWELLLHNPHGRQDFFPPTNHKKLEVEVSMQVLARLYQSDLKRLFTAYTSLEGHNVHARVNKGSFDDQLKAKSRIEVPALLRLLRDFGLVSKQNMSKTKFVHVADIRWVKAGLVPCLSRHGFLPVSVEEVKKLALKWRRRRLPNGVKGSQFVLEDIDMGGFLQLLSQVSLLGFRRLHALQRNYDREAWSTVARRAFRRVLPYPKQDKLQRHRSRAHRGFSHLPPDSYIWQHTMRRRKRIRKENDQPDSITVATAHDLLIAKVSEPWKPAPELDRAVLEAATAPDPYRDADAMMVVIEDRHTLYRLLFETIDTDRSGVIERKELMETLQDEQIVADVLDASDALRALCDVQTFNACFDEIDTDRDGCLSQEELVAFLDAFERANSARQAQQHMAERFTMRKRLIERVKSIFSRFQGLEANIAADRIGRETLITMMQDATVVQELLKMSNAMRAFCDPDIFDDVLTMIGAGAAGVSHQMMLRFCDAYEGVVEMMFVGKDNSSIDADQQDVAHRAFSHRIKRVAAFRRAFELFRPSPQSIRQGQGAKHKVRGLCKTSIMRAITCGRHKSRILQESPALATLFKPRHASLVIRMMSSLSFADDNNPNVVTWAGFRDYCLSYEHRMHKQPCIALAAEGDLLRIDHFWIDGIWTRPSRKNGEIILPKYPPPEKLMCRGELISRNGKLCPLPHPRGIFPFRCIAIAQAERIDFDHNYAATIIQGMVRGAMLRTKRKYHFRLMVPLQAIARGFILRNRYGMGQRARARAAVSQVERAIKICAPQAVLEAVLLRMGLSCRNRSTIHRRLMARNRGFTYAQGHRPDKHHPKFNNQAHHNFVPAYQHKRHYYLNEGLSTLEFIRRSVRENMGNEQTMMDLIKQHNWNRDGYMLYEDVYACIDSILQGNTGGSVVPRSDVEKSLLPMLDPDATGEIATEKFIAAVYAHEESRSTDAMLATKPVGGFERPAPLFNLHKTEVTEAMAHKASVIWVSQEQDVDSLQTTKIYGQELFSSEEERSLIVEVMSRYNAGLSVLFDIYCTSAAHMQQDQNMSFEKYAEAEQISLTNAMALVYNNKLVAPRKKLEHELKKSSHSRYMSLPEGTFNKFACIEAGKEDQIPRITKIGRLPISATEIKQIFNHRIRRQMRWRKLDTATGLTSTVALTLFLSDIADLALPRMEAEDLNIEREMDSEPAVQAQLQVLGGQALTGTGSIEQQEELHARARAAQWKGAQARVAEIISQLTRRQRLEAVLQHLGLDTQDAASLRRKLMFTGKNNFKYPAPFCNPAPGNSKSSIRKGYYLGIKNFEESRSYAIGDAANDIVEFVKKQILNMSIESGKQLRAIFDQFDMDKNGTVEPNELWQWCQRIAPDGMLTPADFRRKFVSELYGIDPHIGHTPEQIARLPLFFDKFEAWVKSSKQLQNDFSTIPSPPQRYEKEVKQLTQDIRKSQVQERRRAVILHSQIAAAGTSKIAQVTTRRRPQVRTNRTTQLRNPARVEGFDEEQANLTVEREIEQEHAREKRRNLFVQRKRALQAKAETRRRRAEETRRARIQQQQEEAVRLHRRKAQQQQKKFERNTKQKRDRHVQVQRKKESQVRARSDRLRKAEHRAQVLEYHRQQHKSSRSRKQMIQRIQNRQSQGGAAAAGQTQTVGMNRGTIDSSPRRRRARKQGGVGPGASVRETYDGEMKLLPGWKAAQDPASGRMFYFNEDTGDRTWDWRKVISAPPVQHNLFTPRYPTEREAVPQPPTGGVTGQPSPRASRVARRSLNS